MIPRVRLGVLGSELPFSFALLAGLRDAHLEAFSHKVVVAVGLVGGLLGVLDGQRAWGRVGVVAVRIPVLHEVEVVDGRNRGAFP